MKMVGASSAGSGIAGKIIIGILIAGMSVSASVGASQYMTYRAVNEQKADTQNVIQKDVDAYLQSLGSVSVTKADTKSKDKDTGAVSDITETQKAEIIKAVVPAVTYGVMKQTQSDYTSMTDKNAEALEKSISEKLDTVLNKMTVASSVGTAVITDEQKEALTRSITAIIEEDIAKTASSQQNVNYDTVAVLKTYAENNINTMTQKIQAYDTQIAALNTDITTLQKELTATTTAATNTASADQAKQLQTQLSNLSTNYSNFANAYNAYKTSVLATTDTLSITDTSLQNQIAETGNKIIETGTSLQAAINLANKNIGDLQTYTGSLNDSLTSVSSDLDDFKTGTGTNLTNLSQSLENAKTALTTAMTTADAADKAELKKLLDDVVAAQTAVNSATSKSITDKESALNTSITTLRTDLTSSLSTLQNKEAADITNAQNALAAVYDQSKSHVAGEYCTYDGVLYKCKESVGAGAFDKTKWDATSAMAEVAAAQAATDTKISQTQSMIAKPYDTAKAYAVGGYCTYNGQAYKCITATAGGPFDAAKWKPISLSDELVHYSLNGTTLKITGP